uniref:GGDEF domain-containing protein n=1 Tax=candidate division WOR-3 bacterium TaxID=2052148 RepID=A0A7C4XJE5_UNCW3
MNQEIKEKKIIKLLNDFCGLNLREIDPRDVAQKIQKYLGTLSFSIFLNNHLLYQSDGDSVRLTVDEESFLKENYKNLIRFNFNKNSEIYHFYFEAPDGFTLSSSEYEIIDNLLKILSQAVSIREFSQTRIIESQIINELNLNVITTLNERKIIWYIESAARRLLDTNEIFLFYAIDDRLIGRDKTIPLRELPSEVYTQLFKARQICYLKDGKNKFLKSIFKNINFTEAIFIPFMIKNYCRGFFVVLNGIKISDQKYFITKLKFLGNQASIALERVELFAALNRALKESQGLQELARIMLTPYKLRLLFDELLKRAQKLLGFKKILCSIYNPKTRAFDRISGVGISKSKLIAAKRVHPPLDLIKKLFKDCHRISYSYYIPAEDVDKEIRKYEIYKTPKLRKRIDQLWVKGDVLISPVYSRNKELLAIISLDEPYNNLVPNIERIKLIEAFGDFLGLTIENHNLFEKIENLSYHDEMTGVYNYRFLREKLTGLIEKGIKPITVSLIDLDNFKKYNDRYGHLRGDEILKKIAHLLEAVVGRDGFVTRYGGDEFIVILPGLGLRGARNRIKKLAHLLSQETPDRKIEFSCGFASFPSDGKNFADLIDFADKKLYLEKKRKTNEGKSSG